VGKLNKADIPARVKPPCKAAQAMLDALDGDDFGLLAAELAAGMTMALAWEWVGPVIACDLSPSAFNNHLKARCSCPPDTPLMGVRRG